MEQHIKNLIGLSEAEVVLLAAEGIISSEQLPLVQEADIKTILPDSSYVLRRKLASVCVFLARGKEITATTTLQAILSEILVPVAATGNTGAAPANTQVLPSTNPDERSSGPKLTIGKITSFDGLPNSWEDWKMEVQTLLGQTQYSTLLTLAPATPELSRRNVELYNMILHATFRGSVRHVVEKFKPTQDGNAAWLALNDWFGSAETSRAIIDADREKLDSLILDENTTATAYINEFIILSNRLESRGEGETDETKRRRFIKRIVDEEYLVTKRILEQNSELDFNKCVIEIRKTEQSLLANDNATRKPAA